MSYYSLIFYLIGATMVVSTVMAITRKNIVHTVLYLVMSFIGSAMLFYLLGAPLLAAMEVIIYAGAIMVLFLFIVMMLTVRAASKLGLSLRELMGIVLVGVFYVGSLALLYMKSPSQADQALAPASASPEAFGAYLFSYHWLSVELISLFLLIVLIGALLMGKEKFHRFASKGKSS